MTTFTVPTTGQVIAADQEAYDKYWQFIYERHTMWYKRFVLQQPMPWTQDVILRDYKFTNVYRELDRGTIYLLDNIIGDVESLGGPKDQVFNTIMYRLFNRIETWDAIKHTDIPYHRGQMMEILRKRMEQGMAIYTDAHLVCAYENFPGDDKLARFAYIFDEVEKEIDDIMSVVWSSKSLGTVWKRLTELKGLGAFLSYEVAVDISYAPWNNLGEDEWVNPGPGCQRGLKRIFPDLKTKDCTWMIKSMREAQKHEFSRLNLPFDAIAYKGRELTLRNIEHCCCEAFKYFKALDGTGRPRNKFRPVANIGDAHFERLKG